MAWTIVPALLLLYIAFAQVNTWANVKYQSRMPTLQGATTPLQAAISARQFEWRIRYPSSQRFEQWMADKDDPKVAVDFASFPTTEQKDDIKLIVSKRQLIRIGEQWCRCVPGQSELVRDAAGL